MICICSRSRRGQLCSIVSVCLVRLTGLTGLKGLKGLRPLLQFPGRCPGLCYFGLSGLFLCGLARYPGRCPGAEDAYTLPSFIRMYTIVVVLVLGHRVVHNQTVFTFRLRRREREPFSFSFTDNEHFPFSRTLPFLFRIQ